MEEKKSPQADIHRIRGFIFSVSLTITLVLTIIIFTWKSKTGEDNTQLRLNDAVPEELLEIPITDQTPPPPPPRRPTVEIIEVPDEEKVEEEIHIDLDLADDRPIEPIIPTEPAAVEEEETDEIMVIVETKAEYPGGKEALSRFLRENVKYPPQARRMGVEGRVFVQAVVEKDGSMTDLLVLKGIGAGCDEEAVRVIKSFPHWSPAKQRGRPVRAKMVFPLTFTLH